MNKIKLLLASLLFLSLSSCLCNGGGSTDYNERQTLVYTVFYPDGAKEYTKTYTGKYELTSHRGTNHLFIRKSVGYSNIETLVESTAIIRIESVIKH